MSTVRAGQPGATRVCPHCKATVLESAAICPGCRHHLRFATAGQQLAGVEGYCAFSVDGTIAHKLSGEPCEYCIVLDVTNERGEQVLRQVVGVGALQPGELRRLNLSVDMLPLATQLAKAQAAQPAAPAREAGGSVSTAGRPGLKPPAPAVPPSRLPVPPPSQSQAPPYPQAQPSRGQPPLQPPPATKPPGAATAGTAAASSTATPSPGSALGQRLRIFRKP